MIFVDINPKKPPNILGLVLEKGLAFPFFDFTINTFCIWKAPNFLYEFKKKKFCLIARLIFSLKSHRLPYDLDQLSAMNIIKNREQNKGGV